MLEMEDGVELVRACLFSCALVVRAGACFVFGFNGHLLAWVADAIVARARQRLWNGLCLFNTGDTP
jgi:hypothetical protein